jgi:hypothetical protein
MTFVLTAYTKCDNKINFVQSKSQFFVLKGVKSISDYVHQNFHESAYSDYLAHLHAYASIYQVELRIGWLLQA